MRRVVFLFLPLIAALTLVSEAYAADKPQTETEKIESLIKHLEGLKGAKFVRNGIAYDAVSAAKFLREKRDTNKSGIKTANDFVEKVASVSGTTGRPYLIRFQDGRETKSGEYLLAELAKLEGR